MKRTAAIVCCILFFKVGLFSQSATSFSTQFSWLIGTWKIETDGGILIEKWKQVDSNTYSAVVNFISSPNDNVELNPLEEITLTFKDNNIYFISRVSGQNNGKSVEFIFTGEEKGWYIFENPDHDFPQKIKYQPIDEKNMQARIEGVVNGKKEFSDFRYSKE